MKTSIRFVYFDLGNVLVSFDRSLVCTGVAKLFGVDPGHVDEVLHIGGLQNDLETGRISEHDFRETLHRRLNERLEPGQSIAEAPLTDVLRAISDMFTPIETMRDVIAQVRRQGLKVGILSNTCNAHWNWVTSQYATLLEGPFDATILSHRAGSMKPDHLIYQVAQQEAMNVCGASPEEILFLDDREENVVAARERGWKSEICFGGDQAIDTLQRHGIVIDTPVQS